MVDASYSAMASAGAIAYYAATTGDENTLWIPGSIYEKLQLLCVIGHAIA